MATILDNKDPSSLSVFSPAALLREARRQKALPAVDVRNICILDPDGDIVRRLRQDGRSKPFTGWPCYHTQLDAFELGGQTAGIVGCAVGAPFAVLIAEELFASGCRFLISVTSAGQIIAAGPTPYFVIIDRACATRGRAITTPPLPNTLKPMWIGCFAASLSRAPVAGDRRGDMNRCAVPRNRRGDRGGEAAGHAGRRNGSGGALRLCRGEQAPGALSRACDQHDGADEARAKKAKRTERRTRSLSWMPSPNV